MITEQQMMTLRHGDKVLVECTVEAVFVKNGMVMVTTRDFDEGFDAYQDEIIAVMPESCEDTVNREDVLEIINDFGYKNTHEEKLINARIKALPPATSKPKTGKWIKEESIYGWDGKSYQCSVCGRSIHLDTKAEDLRDYPYCHCGAKMEGVSE